MKEAIFFALAAFTVAAALLVVLGRNIVHSAVALIFSFCGVAGIYVLLDAEFLAAVQVLIYVGGITILLLFAIMLTTRIAARVVVFNEQVGLSALIVLGITAILVYASLKGIQVSGQPPAPIETAPALGRLLLTTHVLPFEVASVLLLAAMVGAIILARREKE
ncbi:MAG: NADH-quinone oxidoreductase subunit J [Candidatus Methylomirabilales bacterium]